MSRKTTHRSGAATLYVTSLSEKMAHVTAVLDECTDPRRAAAETYANVAEILADRGLDVVQERVFGSLTAHAPILDGRAEALEKAGLPSQTPLTYLQGRPLWGVGMAGMSLMAVRPEGPKGVWPITNGAGQAHGRAWQCEGTTFFLLQDIHGRRDEPGVDNTRDAQADRMFDLANDLLQGQEIDYRAVCRTWIYLSKILDWYGDFNLVRNAKYGVFGLMPEPGGSNGSAILLPASTGIEGDAPHRAEAAMDVLATVVGPDSPVEIHQMTNLKQKDAFKYGSAFSRGAAIRMPEFTWISISGTAAIDETGETLFVDDFRKQMNCTLDTVEALIEQEGATLADLCDTTAFIKLPKDVETYRQVAAERGLSDWAAVPVIADVCRDDLLFEMDGAAVVARQ